MTRGPAPARLRAVLFDLDGTLADSEPHIARALVAALAEFGYEVTGEAAVASLGPPMAGMLDTLVGPLPPERQHEIREAYLRHYRETIEEIAPLPGAVELMRALDELGVVMAVVTNKGEDSATEQLEAMRWMERFAVLVGYDTAARPKPAADPARYALERLAIPSEAAAFVGDTPTDAECGHAAGIATVIGLTRMRPAKLMTDAGATHTCSDLAEATPILVELARNGSAPA